MADKIFYGAGNYTELKIYEWECKVGIPVCFADNDPQKWYTRFPKMSYISGEIGRYEILPPDEAFTRYPNADIYITVFPEHYKKIYDFLTKEKKISSKRIKTPQELKYRDKSCVLHGKAHDLGYTDFTDGCTVLYVQKYPYNKTDNPVAQSADMWKQKTLSLDSGKSNCFKCPASKPGYYYAEPELCELRPGYGFYGETCNLRCSYCVAGYDKVKPKTVSSLSQYEFLKQLENDPVSRELSRFVNTYHFCAAEPVLSPHFNDMLDILEKKKVRILIYTNATLYNESLARLLQSGYGYIRVSLDCGTRETFLKLKGVDLFDKVKDNLMKYSPKKATPSSDKPIQLKYIFTEGVNDNTADIDGFFEIAGQVSCDVILSLEAFSQGIYDKVRERVLYFIKRALEKNICVSGSLFFNPGSAEVEELKRELDGLDLRLLRL